MSRKPYMRPVSKTGWYFKHPRYMRYMSREITCIFVGALAILMVRLLASLAQGQQAYEAFLASLRGPAGVVGLLLIFAFVTYNATNWFNVTPKAMPVQRGEEFVDGKIIVGAHYALWAVASLVVLLFAGVL